MQIEKQKRAKLIKERLPEVFSATLEKAQMYMENKFILPGTGAKPLFAGNPIEWLDNKAGDNEYLWQLNRMLHYQTLLQAYALTEDEKYAKKVLDDFVHWVRYCPAPEVPQDSNQLIKAFSGVHPWRILEVGIRAYKTFPLVMEYLEDEAFFTEEIRAVYKASMMEHATYLEKVSPILWPKADHNHFLMEMLGLLTVAITYPEEPQAKRWKELAVDSLERCNRAQLTDEGGQIEGCPMYHNGCMFWFGHSLVMAQKYGFAFSEDYINRYRKALDYSILALRTNGTIITWGDSTAKNNAVLSAVYGYAVFGSMEWFDALLAFSKKEDVILECVEHLWRIPDLEGLLDRLDSNEKQPIKLPLFNWQGTLKQVFMRSSWEKDGLAILFACRTPIQNLHAHIDPMSFDFSALGKPLVVDPGIVTYQNNEKRYNLKSAAYHNTLAVNNKDHFEYTASFGFGPQKFGTIYDAKDTGKLKYAQAIHMEYCPLVHKRTVALYEDKFLLVLDIVDNLKQEDSIQLYYHINSVNVQIGQGCCHTNDDANVVLYYSDELTATMHDGIVGERVDVWHDSKRLKLECSAKDSKRVYATLICPYRKELPVCEDFVFDGVNCSFYLDGQKYVFEWTADSFFGAAI